MVIHTELQTALESLVSAFKDLCANPKPNYSLDGQSVSWGEYFNMLAKGIKDTQELIASFDVTELRTSIL